LKFRKHLKIKIIFINLFDLKEKDIPQCLQPLVKEVGMSILPVPRLVNPFPFPDSSIFQESMQFLEEVADIGRAATVCTSWNTLIQSLPQSIWKNLFEREGIPLVMGLKGQTRNYREDLKVLYPITISGRVISQLFGKVIGQVPPISEKWFNKLQEKDPFERKKSIGETFVFVVLPSLITRTADPETPLVPDGSGDLIKLSKLRDSTRTSLTERGDLTFPLSLKNLRTICSYPLRGKEHMPVFRKGFWPDLLKRFCPDTVGLYFMRKQIAAQSRGLFYFEQEEFIKRKGFEITPLRERALFDSVTILKSGTCPDNQNPTTYVCNPDTIHFCNEVYQTAIGGFVPHAGVLIQMSNSYDRTLFGVVPGVSAEVLATET
jgi:hypothetical protein